LEIDLEQLRRQYAGLTDEALLEIEADDLVDAARQCYDAELVQRRIRPEKRQSAAIDGPDAAAFVQEGEPDWIGDAMSVMSMMDVSVLDARNILDQAGIPCYVAPREPELRGAAFTYDLLVQPGRYLLAVSILDRDLLNLQAEDEWKAQFAGLTDQDLMDLDADLLVAGMRDRIERLVRTYEDELLKRGLAELETGSAG
jgi:hypothetical protein